MRQGSGRVNKRGTGRLGIIGALFKIPGEGQGVRIEYETNKMKIARNRRLSLLIHIDV